MNSVYFTLGSNIEPELHLQRSIQELRSAFGLVACSSVIETISDGSSGPNFLNAAGYLQTTLSSDELKFQYFRPLESRFGRIRSADKNAPRPIDLDVAVFNGQVVDLKLWTRVYLALPLSEFLPGIVEPDSGKSLIEIAEELKKRAFWKARLDVDLSK